MGKEYSFHKICIAAIFFFDTIALHIPLTGAKNGELSALIVAVACSVALYLLWYFIADRIYKSRNDNYIVKVICFLIIAFLVYANTVAAKNFTSYMNEEVLIKNIRVFILLLFSAVCIYMVSKTNEVLAKSALILFVFIVIVMAIMLIVSFKNFEPVNVKELLKGTIFKRSFVYLYRAFLFPIALAMFSRFAFYNATVKKDILGLLAGTGLILVCFFSTVATFTLKFASKIDYSYPMSISVVNIGELYTRMDGFAYFIFFFSALIRCSVCGFGIKMLLKKAGTKSTVKKTAFLMLGSFLLSYVI